MLRLEGVTAGYGGTTVLRGADLDVGDGEVVGIVGRNGVGKTTTLRSVVGNVTPRSGSVRFDGAGIADIGPEATVRRGVALVPEERRVFRDLTVRENLELAALGGAGAGRDVDAVLGTFENLAERERAAGGTLSGGEQQMLAIARALVGGARLFMLDEPTEGLAPYVIERVVETVEELRDRGLTVLLVEQNVYVALEVCDHVYVMDDGRVVHDGSAAELAADETVLDRYLGVNR
ncbi:ABC transporter ATP-binding protein [Halobacteriales archaeon QS_5_70_15]|nr:MAG: ABC transporter ATP-binding protein [Halobacteriales archaeon QS_5_70_15]